MDATALFRDAIRAAGLDPPEEIEADGRIHRFGTNGKRGDDAGWYVKFTDPEAGAFGCWRGDINQTWSLRQFHELSTADREKLRRTFEEITRKRAEELERRRAEAASRAIEIWGELGLATGDHPYLVKKNVGAYGTRVAKDGRLVVPVLDVETLELISLQFIPADGKKMFLAGGRTGGGFFQIGVAKDNTVLIAEGYATAATLHEATGHAVAVAFSAGNLTAVAEGLRKRFADYTLALCADVDASGIGVKKATEAADAVGGVVIVPEVKAGGTDFNDMQQVDGQQKVKAVVANMLTTGLRIPKKSEIEGEKELIARLAKMGILEYARARKPAAEQLEVDVSSLDKAVKEAKEVAEEGLQGRAITFNDPKPWPDPVDGRELLEEIVSILKRYVVLPPHAEVAIAFWVVLSHLVRTVDIAPILAVTSPAFRCGKTTLLGILQLLVPRQRTTSNISPSALFRVVELYQPTLIVDEGDSFLHMNEQLRGLLNSGHTRTTAWVTRCVGDDSEPRDFCTWGFKAVSAIVGGKYGRLPPTIIDRSFVIDMQRKRRDQRVEKLRHADPEVLKRLAAKLARWAADHADAVKAARPGLPGELNDREADNWEGVAAVADIVGGDWPDRARLAALALSGTDDSLIAELLADIRAAFGDKDRMFGKDLVAALVADPERPWKTFGKGKDGLTQHRLCRLLEPVHVVSAPVWIGGESARGYLLEKFSEAFSQYLPAKLDFDSSNRQDLALARLSGDFQNVRESASDESKIARKPSTGAGLDGLTNQNPVSGEKSVEEGSEGTL